ncbi:hypothetical protein BFC20_03070 [Brochothrix thermosphacta]|uniref:DUF2599 domain-containing protein n=1 Tax=Brochothrix thermosphacta TaxID=2756 RepID=UPI000E73C427|nr:DUF2599 domain-containing protein [Brochothrix thermosphacta]ANZ96785.1 hypothetical protein BFC20_03070 [Brochothrix thermosphacta]
MKKIVITLLCTTLILTNVVMMNSEVQASEDGTVLFEKGIVDELSPQPLVNVAIEEKNERFIAETDESQVTIPKDMEEPAILSDNEEGQSLSMQVNLDEKQNETISAEDTVVYETKNTSLGIDAFDGGLRHTYVMENKEAPNTFEVKYDADNISHLELSKDGEGKTDGSILIYDKAGETLAALDIPWAKDANGKDVETYYQINENNTVKQVIKVTDEVVYPVIADPTTFTTYFSSGKWIVRGKGKYNRSLSLVPKAKLRASGAFSFSLPFVVLSNAVAKDSWNKVYNKYKNSKHWEKTTGMKNQYMCHFNFVWGRSAFNLEPKRPVKNYLMTVANGCNPK